MSIPSPNSYFASATPAKVRRRGSRAQLANKFFADTYAAWEEQGEAVLARAAFHDPVAFMNMVARLMPQKIEVTTPTDGLSDERLSELLDYAERMASLRADSARIDAATIEGVAHDVTPAALALSAHSFTDENALRLDGAEEGGGGPLREMVVGEGRTSNTARPETTEPTSTPHNPLNSGAEGDFVAGTPHSQNATEVVEAKALPYPVGRAQPFSAVEVARINREKLVFRPEKSVKPLTPIDPASLF